MPRIDGAVPLEGRVVGGRSSLGGDSDFDVIAIVGFLKFSV